MKKKYILNPQFPVSNCRKCLHILSPLSYFKISLFFNATSTLHSPHFLSVPRYLFSIPFFFLLVSPISRTSPPHTPHHPTPYPNLKNFILVAQLLIMNIRGTDINFNFIYCVCVCFAVNNINSVAHITQSGAYTRLFVWSADADHEIAFFLFWDIFALRRDILCARSTYCVCIIANK